MPLDELEAAPYNPREISAEALEGLKHSLRSFGLVQPIVWNRRTGKVVGGHQRVRAMRELGETDADVVVVDLGERDEKALNLTLNNPAIAGGFTDGLGPLLAELAIDLPEFEALRLPELSELIPKLPASVVEDEVPDPPAVPVTRPGDLWQLGAHRLLCGDSTKDSDVALVAGGERAVLMNTDPPYGIDYDIIANARGGKKTQHLQNDDADSAKLQVFLEAAIRVAIPVLIENPAFYLWHPMLTQGTFFAAAAAAADILIHRQIVWVKPSLILGRGDYHWRHELCFYGWVRGKRCKWRSGRDQTTVWEVGREPRYCDVVVSRWERLTGKKAQRVENGNGGG